MKALRILAAIMPLAAAVGLVGPAAAATAAPSHVEGVLPDGSTYVMDVPADWNGTVLLYSHGYVPDGAPNPAHNAPSGAVRTRSSRPATRRSARPTRRPAGCSKEPCPPNSPPSTCSGTASANHAAPSRGAPRSAA